MVAFSVGPCWKIAYTIQATRKWHAEKVRRGENEVKTAFQIDLILLKSAHPKNVGRKMSAKRDSNIRKRMVHLYTSRSRVNIARNSESAKVTSVNIGARESVILENRSLCTFKRCLCEKSAENCQTEYARAQREHRVSGLIRRCIRNRKFQIPRSCGLIIHCAPDVRQRTSQKSSFGKVGSEGR